MTTFIRLRPKALARAPIPAVWMLVTSVTLSLSVSAQSPTSATSPMNSAPQSVSVDAKSVDELRKDVAELKRKMEKPPKDNWDKLAAISGLASAIVVALIGFYATNVYNQRQKQSEERRKEQEILVAQIQTIEKFIPHLSSGDEQVKAGALIAIAALGNDNLAVKLATAFGGTGGTSALTTIASTSGPEGAATAGRALLNVFKYLEERIVSIHADDRQASGFIVAADGGVITTAHAIDGVPSDNLSVRLSNGSKLPAKLKKVDKARDLALLIVNANEPLAPLNLSPSIPDIGTPISALFFAGNGMLKIATGTAIGLQPGPMPKIAVQLNTEPGASGGPVVDREGRLLGLIRSSDRKGTAFLIPASEAVEFVNSPASSAGTQ